MKNVIWLVIKNRQVMLVVGLVLMGLGWVLTPVVVGVPILVVGWLMMSVAYVRRWEWLVPDMVKKGLNEGVAETMKSWKQMEEIVAEMLKVAVVALVVMGLGVILAVVRMGGL